MKFIQDFVSLTLKLIGEILEFSFRLFGLALNSGKDDPYYGASFGVAKNILKKKAKGFCLSGNRSLSKENSYRNALVIGGTGTGKSSVVLLPSLYSMEGSFVVHDPSGELYSKSAGYLKSQGYAIQTLNFADPTRSDGYNPLERASSSSEINKIAAAIVETTLGGETNEGSFWNTQAVDLISLLIRIAKHQDKHYQTLTYIRSMLNMMRVDDKLDKIVSGINDPEITAEYQSYSGKSSDDKTVRGIIATAKSALQRFTDGAIQEVTSHNTIDMDAYRFRKTALFIQNPVIDQKYYAVLTSLFFEQLFTTLLKRLPQPYELDVFCLIDEAGLLQIPSFPSVIANVRKYRVGVLLIVQSFLQLVSSYGEDEAQTIRTNCFSRMYFTGQPLETAKELEETIGRYEYEDSQGRLMVRPLLNSTQIRTLPKDQALLFCGFYNPVKLQLSPYYNQRRYMKLSQYPVPFRTTRGLVTSSYYHAS